MELTVKPLEKVGDLMNVNIGPIHPATHGTILIKAQLDGEVIVKAEPEVGYLHRCFEKMCETHPYHTVMPYVDRLNYCSCFMNNVGWAMTVEKLLDLEITKKAQYVRVILNELNRVMDHMLCIGTNLVDLGALTNFWYAFQAREMVYTLLEKCCGARLTVNYCTIGGLMRDIPSDFDKEVKKILKALPQFIEDIEGLITHNRIFIDRTKGINPVTREQAIEWGWTGPCLRAAGVAYDVRKAHPYYDYDKFDFNVPTGENGDVYDRYLVRVAEMYQSMKIVEQALEGLPEGPINVKDHRYVFPSKESVYDNIEALMHHFKFVMHGVNPPAGEVYSYTEAANGELGFYLVSDGGPHPYRVKCRPPCFAIFQAFDELLPGHMVADLVAILGSLNLVMGELDR